MPLSPPCIFRIIISGDKLSAHIDQDTVRAFKYDEEYGLTNDDVSKRKVSNRVSIHLKKTTKS